jgi:hypothetical protein
MEKGLLIMVLTLAIVLMATPLPGDKAGAFDVGTNSYTTLPGSNSTYTDFFSGSYATYGSLPRSYATYGSFSSSFANYYSSIYGYGWNTKNQFMQKSNALNPVVTAGGIMFTPARVSNPPETDNGSDVSLSVSNPPKNPQRPVSAITYPSYMLPLGTSLITYPDFITYPQIVNILPPITNPNYPIGFEQLWSNFPNRLSSSTILPWTLDFTPYLNSVDGYPSIPNYFP